jgi:hypothetical protein
MKILSNDKYYFYEKIIRPIVVSSVEIITFKNHFERCQDFNIFEKK